MSRLSSFQETTDSLTTLRRLRIESQVKAAISNDADLKGDAVAINVQVDPDTLHVELNGGVRRCATHARALETVGRLSIVSEVVDNISVVKRR